MPFSGPDGVGDVGGEQQPGGTTIQASTDTAGEIVTGITENSAMALTADYDNATTYDVSENSTVKISSSGTYIVTGTSSDGSITVTKSTTGVVLVLVPIVLIYVILQRRFIEGVERSGIVG